MKNIEDFETSEKNLCRDYFSNVKKNGMKKKKERWYGADWQTEGKMVRTIFISNIALYTVMKNHMQYLLIRNNVAKYLNLTVKPEPEKGLEILKKIYQQ